LQACAQRQQTPPMPGLPASGVHHGLYDGRTSSSVGVHHSAPGGLTAPQPGQPHNGSHHRASGGLHARVVDAPPVGWHHNAPGGLTSASAWGDGVRMPLGIADGVRQPASEKGHKTQAGLWDMPVEAAEERREHVGGGAGRQPSQQLAPNTFSQGSKYISLAPNTFSQGSKYMSAQQMDTILRIQYMATHPPDSTPYTNDYYYSAVRVKQTDCHPTALVAHQFWPSSLRELLPQERTGARPGGECLGWRATHQQG
jgi:hypothetical protein